MYRVFEALDELVTIVEEARGLPMTASCVVPRGDVLELLDDVRDALPGEVDDAQDVLDHRDQMIGDASASPRPSPSTTRRRRRTGWSAPHMPTPRRPSAGRARRPIGWSARRPPTPRDWSPGPGRGRPARRRRRRTSTIRCWPGRRPRPSGPSPPAGPAYEASVADGRAEQARLVSQTEVVQAAYSESARILDGAHADADRMRAECDSYVDTTLGSLEETLTTTLRTIGRGRTALRSGGIADFRD